MPILKAAIFEIGDVFKIMESRQGLKNLSFTKNSLVKNHTRKTILSIALMLIWAVVGNPIVQAMAEFPEEKEAMVKVLELLAEDPY